MTHSQSLTSIWWALTGQSVNHCSQTGRQLTRIVVCTAYSLLIVPSPGGE